MNVRPVQVARALAVGLLFAAACGVEKLTPEMDRPCWVPPQNAPLDERLPMIDLSPSWSPTGDFIAYYGRPTNDHHQLKGLYRVPVDSAGERTGEPELLLDLETIGWLNEPLDLRVSPDGLRLAYSLFRVIWVLNLESRDTTRVTWGGFAGHPDWHPDGDRLAFARGRRLGLSLADSGGIRILDLGTLEERPLRRRGGWHVFGGFPRWHRDGRHLAFMSGNPDDMISDSDVYMVQPDSSDYIRVSHTNWTGVQDLHWWYLHGEEVVFTDFESNEGEFVVRLSDGAVRCFTTRGCPLNVRAFDFSPDQTKLVTTRPDTTNTLEVLWVLDIPAGRWTQLTAPRP